MSEGSFHRHSEGGRPGLPHNPPPIGHLPENFAVAAEGGYVL
jgi:hypothetical protein